MIDKIVDSLYAHIAVNETLLPIFPEDLEESERKQRLFLTHFFDGPTLYSEERGRPMLPARHAPFEITLARRDAWLECMHQALKEVGVEEPLFSEFIGRLMVPAHRLVNTEASVTENNE